MIRLLLIFSILCTMGCQGGKILYETNLPESDVAYIVTYLRDGYYEMHFFGHNDVVTEVLPVKVMSIKNTDKTIKVLDEARDGMATCAFEKGKIYILYAKLFEYFNVHKYNREENTFSPVLCVEISG